MPRHAGADGILVIETLVTMLGLFAGGLLLGASLKLLAQTVRKRKE